MDRTSRQDLLPDLCQPTRLFGIMVFAELLVVVIIAADYSARWWQEIGPMSLFCQWLALCFTAALCQLRAWLNQRPTWLSTLLITLGMGLITASASWLVSWLDASLAWRLIDQQRGTEDRALANAIIAMSVALAALRYFYLLGRWQNLVRSEADSRLAALQARIRPHFLFNSMNSIAALISIDAIRAERAIENLSDLVRASLSTAREKTSSLGEELELVARYLELEQLRLGERLTVDWQRGEGLPLETRVPSLLLQPLVENAITHGIAPRPEGGRLELYIQANERRIMFTVSNPKPPAQSDRVGGGHGMALENIRARLHHFWNGQARLHCREEGDAYLASLDWPRLPEPPA
jgi:two-component system sensor histidine kinase AlgZ